MGVTRLTAMTIQGQGYNIVCESYGGVPETDNKFGGVISLFKEGKRHSTLASSDAIFDTSEKAIDAMKGAVEDIRKMDLMA